ncbi:MAG: hypothetical protein ACK456_01910 [Pseudanabaenaceae cyanobacterium]|jgi:hypothetical protein
MNHIKSITRGRRKVTSFYLFLLGCSVTLHGCADTSIVPPVPETNPLLTHRWIALGAAILLGVIQLIILSSKSTQLASALFEYNAKTILTLPLSWTIIGQWFYIVIDWIFSLWNPLISIIGFLNGYKGNISLCLIWIVLLGFVFPSSVLFYWAVLPTLLGLLIHMFILSWVLRNDES